MSIPTAEPRAPRLAPPTGGTIVKFTAENFMRLSAVEITPSGSIFEIRGSNFQAECCEFESRRPLH